MNSTHTLHIDGGRYISNVLARTSGWTNWFPKYGNYCVDPCLVGAYEALPFFINPYKPVHGTDTDEFQLALTILLSSFAALGIVVISGFLYIFHKSRTREHAKNLMELQEERRARIERGEKYQ